MLSKGCRHQLLLQMCQALSCVHIHQTAYDHSNGAVSGGGQKATNGRLRF